MQVKVKYRSQHLAELAGTSLEEMEATTVKDILRNIKVRCGAEAEKSAKSMLIAVNGESILHLRRYKTALQAGDEVAFLPICGGG